jgi:CheY-like chemotaxis protein
VAAGDLIMVVEDNDDAQDAICTVLRHLGYECLVAPHGLAALDALRGLRLSGERAPSLILLDVQMPVMGGWEFRDAQLADPAIASIPVIFLTADPVAQRRIDESGVVAFIRKPLDVPVLIEAVRRIC